jgi:hypothetical protein
MATTNKCTGLKVLEPIQGLVDYVNDIKPYHTKIVEVLVEYVYGEVLDVTFREDMLTDIEMFRPEDPELSYECPRGYSLLPYGTPGGGWPIIPPNQGLTPAEYNTYPAFNVSAGSITVPGNRVSEIKVGSQVEVVTWIEDFSDPYNIITLPDPSGNFNKFFTVADVEYNDGSIDQWPGHPDPATYELGNDPHTIITLQGGFGSLPTLTPDQIYLGSVRLAPTEIERVYSYSNATVDFDSSGPNITNTPDEGYLRKDIVGVTLSTLDGLGTAIPDTGKVVVSGNLLKSNIFVGDQVVIYESTGNNGVYNIASLSYDTGDDETTIGVVERIRDLTVDGLIRIDIPSNVFVIDGNFRSRFTQGYVFNVAGGSFAGQYTTLTSDFVDGKTRIRPTRDVINTEFGTDIVGISVGFIVHYDMTSRFPVGSQVNVVGSPTNDGSYIVVAATYDSIQGQTEIEVCPTCHELGSPITAQPVDPEIGGQLFPVTMGVIKETLFGFGESSDLCATTPHTMVRVKFQEYLTFEGLGLDLSDDLIVYNMENNDVGGYELPLFTAISSTEPTITESPTPPVAPSLNEFWFNTGITGSPAYTNALHQFNGTDWKPITTAYWLDSDTKLLYYRTKTTLVDTNWVLYLAEPPGFNDIQPAIGAMEIIGSEAFTAEEVTPGVVEDTFAFRSFLYDIADITDGTLVGTEDNFVVAGNVKQDADGIDTSVGTRTLTVAGGGANDGVYTISNVVYISADDQTKIFVEENIPSVVVAGQLTIGPLSVPGSDESLIQVTVNNVPASIVLNTDTEFTILSPYLSHGDTVRAEVYDRTRQETNANVNEYSQVPHQVFHDGVSVIGSPAYAYVLNGGDYVHRMIPQNVLNVYDISGGSLLGQQRPMSFGILEVSTATGSPSEFEITISGLYDSLFTPGVVLSALTSDGVINEFVVVGAVPAGSPTTDTIITVAGEPSATYESVFGAVYDPATVQTYVVPNTPLLTDADAISYTWYGPLRIELAMAFQNSLTSSVVDSIGASDEIITVPAQHEILVTDAGANTIRIHYDDPLTGLPVNLTDSFTPGTFIQISGSYNENTNEETNNAQYVVKTAYFDDPLGSPVGNGDTVITIEDDFDNIPPYVELDVLSATNAGGSPANESQLVVNGNLSGVVSQYGLEGAVVRFDQPIIDTDPIRNATTITRVEYTGGTTTFTFDDNIIDEAFTGALGFITAQYRGNIYYDSTNITGSPAIWVDGYLIREGIRIDTTAENVAGTTITENLDFGWGTTQRWAIKSTDAATDTIFIDGDISGILDNGDISYIVSSQGNDGEYEVVEFTYNPGPNETAIVVRTTGSPSTGLPVDPPTGFEGYFQLENVDITSWYQYLIVEAISATNTFVIYGNATSDVQAGTQFRVFGTLNDGVYTVSGAPIYNADNTTSIEVISGSPPAISQDDTGGWIESYRDYGIRLIFEDAIGVDITENVDATLVLTSGSLLGAYDYPYFDIGAFDEDYSTVVHLYGNTF